VEAGWIITDETRPSRPPGGVTAIATASVEHEKSCEHSLSASAPPEIASLSGAIGNGCVMTAI
jgi:hypothetical protein